MKKALITGVAGQDGSYLSELLLSKDYEVYGVTRRHSNSNYSNLDSVIDNPNFHLLIGDITDQSFIFSCISSYKFDEVYNLAAQSFVKSSFEQPFHTFDVDTTGVLNILEAIRITSPETRLYQASTSEMFGSNVSYVYDVQGCGVRYDGPLSFGNSYENRSGSVSMTPEGKYDGIFQDEETPFSPQSPYAIAKIAAHNLCKLYRESYNLFVSCGILFNHEGERRSKEFVTRKVTTYVAELNKYLSTHSIHDKNTFPKLQLGNLKAIRDWGHAQDYVRAMYLMLQYKYSDDFIVATNESHTIEDLCKTAFSYVGLDWKEYVEVNEQYKRPSEVNFLCGDYSKAKGLLKWSPTIDFKTLIENMVVNDIWRLS